jgi:hypothetical protein
MSRWTHLLLAALLAVSTAASPSWPYPQSVPGLPGFLVLAEQRFDPAIQRLIAEGTLKMMPLSGGQLFYVYPYHADPYLEEQQIRYLEALLERQAHTGEPHGESP